MGDRPTVALLALGCRVSRSDLDALASALGDAFEVRRAAERAEYAVVNTCTVTADADAAARQAIRRLARLNPSMQIVVAGCYAEVRPDELAALPGVVAVVGPRSRPSVPEVLERLAAGREPPARAEAGEFEAGFGPPPLRPFGGTRAFLKVQDGCDARCAYCVVPMARGPARSLAVGDALARIETLGGASAEVVLTGVHLGAYGRDLAPRSSLAQLLATAARRRLAHRIRLSSIEPNELAAELFDGPARALLCEHLHLPLQSGSAAVLAAMRRPYSPRAYASAVERLVDALPGACVGADVITGFPGETAADHRATVALVQQLPLAYLHVFPYSPRPGTAAAAMPEQVAPALSRERAQELSELSDRRWQAFAAAQRGHELEVVVERVAGGFARGTSRAYVKARWPASGERRGDLVRVRVEASAGEECLGVKAGVFERRLPP